MPNDNVEDPFAPRDATMFRPRPGAGRRGAERPTGPIGVDPGGGASRGAAPTSFNRASPVAAMRDFNAAGLNPLLQAASPLLIMMGKLRTSLSNPDIGGLRRQALEQMREFEDRARAGGCANETVIAARYVLCAALDEAVLSTPWGGQSEWGGQSLLVTLHRETWGGEKFFDMLERIGGDPARHIDLMELQYICLALGFAGKYGAADRGHTRLAEIEADLYRRIREHRGTPSKELSLHWQGMQDRRNPVIRYVPWWVVGAFSLLVVAGTFIYFQTTLAALAAPVNARLAHIGLGNAPALTASTAPSAAPRLRPLLAADEAAGILKVEERGNQTVVTLISSDLFGSGSAVVNNKYDPSLDRIAKALSQVPGRVFVIGHTDDVPLRSLKFQDNYDLSRARAAEVVKLLSRSIDNTGRLEAQGHGDAEPRYKPASLPANRARNRRVEIVHMAEG